ncbi:MAG: hypothetical protein J0L61_12075 [Planctomycetes bacterium]|nr:hypothetical protein [Planctomycetota bacterium]
MADIFLAMTFATHLDTAQPSRVKAVVAVAASKAKAVKGKASKGAR